MDFRNTLQMINLVLAVASIFPAAFMLRKLIRERKLVVLKDRWLSRALTAISVVLVVLALTNAVIASLSAFGFGRLAHLLSPLGRLIVNTTLSTAAWMTYLVNKEIERN